MDLELYEEKSKKYVQTCAKNAVEAAKRAKDANENLTEAPKAVAVFADPIDFWIKQVI